MKNIFCQHENDLAMCLSVKVEEVKRRQHCLMFSSAGSQAQTYFVNFDTLADYQRWYRQASKVSKQWKAGFIVPIQTPCALYNKTDS